MNCLDFRREKLADPRRLSGAALDHEQACAECTRFALGIDRTEVELEQALAVPVPDALAERILLRQRTQRRATLGRRGALALAAGVVAAAVVPAVLSIPFTRRDPSRGSAELAIEHVRSEPEAFTEIHLEAYPDFAAMVAALGGRLAEPFAGLRYIKLCPVEGGRGCHVVFESEMGLATLILVPNRPLDGVATASVERWNALVRPAGPGHYAVVTPSADATALADRLVRQRLVWTHRG